MGHEEPRRSQGIIPNPSSYDERKAGSSKNNHFLWRGEHRIVIRNVPVNVDSAGKSQQNTPVVRFIDQLWSNIFECAQANVRWPIEALDYLVWKIVVEHKVQRGLLHRRLCGCVERLFEFNRLLQRIMRDIWVHAANLRVAVAFAMKLVEHGR